MNKYPIVLDLETKGTFREVDKHKDLGISVVGIYDYGTEEYSTFSEQDLNKLFLIFENCSYIIGFNIDHFDMQVLQAHYPGKITQFQTFDICEDIKNRIGRRLGLNDIIFATLGKRKTGHGFLAIDLYRQGKMDELKRYCLDDVRLTKELFDYGVKKGTVNYLDEKGKNDVPVDWKKYLNGAAHKDLSLTLPF